MFVKNFIFHSQNNFKIKNKKNSLHFFMARDRRAHHQRVVPTSFTPEPA